MERTFSLPPNLAEELEGLEQQTQRFSRGELSPAEYRALRVPQGIYEQREPGTFMLRVRFPAGGILPHHLESLAAVSRAHGNGVVHVTTRQDIQVHDVTLNGICPALRELYRAGLSTKGGGGNTVRNITSCFDSGVCSKEEFDVYPHAVALTEFLLPDPLSFQLPRKYKIGFSGCGDDCTGAIVNDLGFLAKTRDGERGFAVYVGGGLGATSRVGEILEDFVSEDQVHLVAEAVKRVFDQFGNRRNRHRARLRFLVEKLGLDGFRRLYNAELSGLKRDGRPKFTTDDRPTGQRGPPGGDGPPGPGFENWRQREVTSQKQAGYYLVHIPLFLGDIQADTLEKLAAVVRAHGGGMVRSTQAQNLVLPWVRERELPALHRELDSLNLAGAPAPVLRNLVACTGASTCRLGICLSRGLARAVADEISRGELDLDGLGEFRIHISGCPNACGRHPLGQIGFYGAARRVRGELVPHYNAQVGGRLGEGRTRLAQGKNTIPARNVPAFTASFLRAFQDSPEYPDFHAFVDARGENVVAEVAARYMDVPHGEEEYFSRDWGAEDPFSLAGRGPGECGAGVFDLIEVDLASARDAVRSGNLLAATALAARSLLVTQGKETRNDLEALEAFAESFLDAGLIPEAFRSVVDEGRRCAGTSGVDRAFIASEEDVSALVDAVDRLYRAMDPSLRFRPLTPGAKIPEPPEPAAPVEEAPACDREANLRGLACPLNYVRTKILLEQMPPGQVLAVLLDTEGASNVPDSVTKDGHDVVAIQERKDHWRVVIRKSGR